MDVINEFLEQKGIPDTEIVIFGAGEAEKFKESLYTQSESNFIHEFDGVWACASLIHLPERDLKVALTKLTNATKSGGVLYFSIIVINQIFNIYSSICQVI